MHLNLGNLFFSYLEPNGRQALHVPFSCRQALHVELVVGLQIAHVLADTVPSSLLPTTNILCNAASVQLRHVQCEHTMLRYVLAGAARCSE